MGSKILGTWVEAKKSFGASWSAVVVPKSPRVTPTLNLKPGGKSCSAVNIDQDGSTKRKSGYYWRWSYWMLMCISAYQGLAESLRHHRRCRLVYAEYYLWFDPENLFPSQTIGFSCEESFIPKLEDIAGGLWFPYATSHPKVYDWCERTRQFYSNLDESYGVEVPKFIWYEHGEESRLEREKWAHLFPDLKKIPASGRLPKHVRMISYLECILS